MSNEPLVSIIVPVFNTGVLIVDFIKSVLSQTYSFWELILVDDGSNKETLDYIESLKILDSRIVFFKRERQPKGSLTCRNIGLQHANGKYIIHFDADDLISPQCLAQRVSFMEKNPSLDYAIFKGATFFSDESSKIHLTNHRWGRKRSCNDIVSFLSNDYPFSVWNCIYRASIFKDNLWDENVKIYTDFSYIVPILMSDFKYAYNDESVEDYFYRVNQKNAMTSSFISKDKYDSTIYLFEKTQNAISILKKKKDYKKAFKRYYLIQIERILNTKEKDMILGYKEFYTKHYGPEIRLSVLLKLFFGFSFIRKRRMIRLLITLLYRPDLLKNWLSSKFVKN